jgi:secondary thiamine-phosphate synthase enzyme
MSLESLKSLLFVPSAYPALAMDRRAIVLPGMVTRLSIRSPGPGLHEITDQVREAVRESGVREGLCTIFIQHTSASLTIQENADPSARRDLEAWLNRLVPERDPLYTHTTEGPDDMPSHVKAALTATSLSIPILDGELGLGTWQGIYLWEHRRHSSTRKVLVHVA